MSDEDRVRWDDRYARHQPGPAVGPELPIVFQPFVDTFPTAGQALDLACGLGSLSVWLARRGLHVWGLDVSPVAISAARALADDSGLAGHCRFEVADLDGGLPAGPHVELVVCNKFRDPGLDSAIIGRLAPGGLLAVSALSQVGATPGPFRVKPGELQQAFAKLDHIAAGEAHGEAHGEAWLLARKPKSDA
ncbi:class I SAM-dependent methyltransferase [soil metagenome]